MTRRNLRSFIDKGFQRLFFCDYQLNKVFQNDLFYKMAQETGASLCYELAALAMFVLADFDTAVLHQNRVFIEKSPEPGETVPGIESGIHSYVTFVHRCQEFVLDLSVCSYPIPKSEYESMYFLKVEELWSCTYEEFWGKDVSEQLFRLMQSQQTSKILIELAYYRPEASKHRDFDGKYCGFNEKLTKNFFERFRIGTVGRFFVAYPMYNKEINLEDIHRLMLDERKVV